MSRSVILSAVSLLACLASGCAQTHRPTNPPSASADTVRVAGIVLKWVTADRERNCNRVEPLIREAAARHAQIVVTTECFLDGYAIRDKSMPIEQWRSLSETIPDGPYVRRLRNLARQLKIFLVVGLVENVGGATCNTAILINPDGAVIGKYHKHNLEHELVRNTPGSEYPVFQTPFGRLGLIICADRRDPELVAKIAANGADFIICPSGGMWGPEKNDFYLQDRSRENHLPIVFVHPIEFLVTGPDGAILDRRFAGTRMSLEPGQIAGPEDLHLVALYDLPLRQVSSAPAH
jgi:predicted amidohydrolase